ncbi:MAG: hypothetical protein NT076_00955 [Candidatus Pacearchaeota archaeon]|nr:hypothetical protein [Candidatus Pacearchaeota archaeon]
MSEKILFNPDATLAFSELEKQGYKINPRRLSDAGPLFSDDYKKFNFPFSDETIIYVGVEHCNKMSSDEQIARKKCNRTAFRVLDAELGGKRVNVLPSSFGHFHPLELELQEIYEFQDYGAMVIDHDSSVRRGTDFVIVKPKGKIAVPGKCNMTIYGFGELETWDFANPRQNESNKDLQKQKGAIFCLHHSPQDMKVVFALNPKYNPYSTEESRTISVDVSSNIGKDIYEQASQRELRKRFARIGIRLATSDMLPGIPGIPTELGLEQIVERKDTKFQELFNLK